MQIDHSPLPLKTAKASARLSQVIDCDSILQYATTIKNPYELEVIEKMISHIGLHNRCRKADVMECTDFVHELTQDAYQPKIIHQHNDQCQQFFGKMNRPKFYSLKNKNRYE